MSDAGPLAQTVFPSEKPKGTRKGFVRIDNALAQDKRLSFGCRGMLLHVLSKPKHFRHSAQGLSYQGLEGTHSLEGYIREAIQYGYCKRAKNRTAKGHIESTLTYYETPQPTAENWLSAPTATLPAVGEPTGRSTDCRLDGSLLNEPPRNDCLRNDPPKETRVCGDAEPPPPAHTPSFLSVVQADFPDKDVPDIWQKMIEEYASKPQRLTEHRLREWCKTEHDKPAAKRKKPSAASIASKLAQDGPPGWRDTGSYTSSIFGMVDSMCYEPTWRGVSAECRDAVLAEMNCPADWDENPESRKMTWC